MKGFDIMSPLEVVLLIVAGFVGKRFLSSRVEWGLRKFINYVLFPIFTFYNLAPQTLSGIWGMRDAVLFGSLVPVVAVSIAYLLSRNLERNVKASVLMLSVFGNSGALGIPMTSLFVEDTTAAVIFLQGHRVGFFLLVFIGAYYAHEKPDLKATAKDVILFPPVIAAIVAILLPFNVPGSILNVLSYPTSVTLPIMLFYFGSRLKISKPDFDMVWRIGISKMIVPTALVLLVSLLVDLPSRTTILVEASMPPAILANLLIGEYGLGEKRSVSVTMFLTVISISILVLLSTLGG